ncbi:uncharacterized protein LOC125578189 [Brassica napus]|uniref:uncharacterized protein LOC125578189 n=1 Tax=Brassica napus TaxID=3708 RepID=UPI0020789327|nr:uncharacterized protein LOC125578189 [Brassica napus]
MDLGIPINSTVEKAIQMYRARRHRVHPLRQVDREIMALKNKGLNQLDDICLWKRENGEFKTYFRTSHTWNLVRSSSPKVSWVKGVWFTEATPRFSFLVWLAIHDRLATGDRILRWNPQAVSTCWLCNTEVETRDHLFFEYSFSKEVWIGTIKQLDVAYALWHERDVRRVGEASQPATCLIARLDKLIRNRISSLRRRVGGKYEKMMEDWFNRG